MKLVQKIGQSNPLGYADIRALVLSFAIPSVVGMVANAIYNIVDQIFIGWGVGYLGNAATNVAFPLVTLSVALALLFGNGSAAKMSLELGAGNQEKARQVVGTGVLLLGISGVLLLALIWVFFQPLLIALGSTPDVLPYARDYIRGVSLGIPFLIFSVGFSAVIRADGDPRYSMLCVLSGVVMNTILAPVFLFALNMGVFGVGLATSLSQLFSFFVTILYIPRLRHVRLSAHCLQLKWDNCRTVFSCGLSHFINQISITVVQIVLNNSLVYYGALSIYGSDIPLACAGLIIKVNTIVMAFVIGLAQASQPIIGFNYGAGQYERVRKTFRFAMFTVTLISVAAFLAFQIFPRQIISLFGRGSEAYYVFSQRYFRVFMFFTFINGIQPVSSNFFTSIGKATKGAFLALTRQILCLLPLVLLLPLLMGIDGILYAGPAADLIAAALSVYLISREMKRMRALEAQEVPAGEQPLFAPCAPVPPEE